ncbi:uncharacterized protein RB166_008031 [Leptodactylus fuscus]
MQNVYGNPMGKTKQVYNSSKDDDDDDDDYENTNPCDLAPTVPSRTTRKMKTALKEDLALKLSAGIVPKETPRFQPPPIGLDLSSGAVNAAFSDVAVLANKTFPDLEVMSNSNRQRSGRCKKVVLTGFMVLIFVALVGTIGFIFTYYAAVSEKVVDLEKAVSDSQKNFLENKENLEGKMANLSITMVKLQDILLANVKQINKTLDNICTLCPIGWSKVGQSCYFVSGEEMTWDKSRAECNKLNSVLVMVKDKTESETLKKLFQFGRRYWIGLRRDPGEVHIWKWLDGTEISFTNWDVNEPNYYGKTEHCGETISGPWNDRSCTDRLFYICKRLRTC